MSNADKYELVVGLEVHAQLLTETKLFSGDSAAFGGDPNTHISPITLAHPGTLPKLNKKAVDYAIRMGMACNCSITKFNYFERKNYFYPDLPKGYQISQLVTPICVGGHVEVFTNLGSKKIQLNRIHLEEDAGKSIHDVQPGFTCVDYNRSGVPLIEIVTEPDIHHSEEAYAYLTELRKRLRYLDICDGNMEEGSMRCDANISIRLKGDPNLGTKVEVKNLNSIRNVKRAIELEFERLVKLMEADMPIKQETRSFDASNGTTFSLRSKEEANDYRYFPDPDLSPFVVTDEMLQEIREQLPALPEFRVQRYIAEMGIPEYDARVITDEKEYADYFEELASLTSNKKAAANWMIGPVKAYLNDHNKTITELPVKPAGIARIIELTEQQVFNFSIASTRIFPALIKDPEKDPMAIATELNLVQDSDASNIEAWVDEALQRMPDKVIEYKKGKKGLIGLFVGEVKKISKGKADPKITNELLIKKLS
ncbi:MAG: Asp-tRNA(Asn)/Glu-tRNA(Gln) amidotransferase subunit GatB [Flavitalea sp.]